MGIYVFGIVGCDIFFRIDKRSGDIRILVCDLGSSCYCCTEFSNLGYIRIEECWLSLVWELLYFRLECYFEKYKNRIEYT